MPRLLLFNLRTDADDHILGFTTRWINGLADHYDAIDVLTMHAGRIDVAANVRVFSVGRERGYHLVRRLLLFYGILLRLLLKHRYSACFAHMMPLFAALGGPLLTLFRVPTTVWYTQRQITLHLRAALWLSRRAVTAVPSSFPLASRKVRAIGHGIDTAFFAPSQAEPTRPARVVYVARLTPVKDQLTLLYAAERLPDVEVVLVGDVPDGYDDAYKRELQRVAQTLGLTPRVIFAGAQTPQQVRAWYHSATVAVNLSPVGLFDKAALESMAAGIPTLVRNAAFAPVLGAYADSLLLPTGAGAVEVLVRHLRMVLGMTHEERRRAGAVLRQGVIEAHSLDALLPRLVAVLETGQVPAAAP